MTELVIRLPWPGKDGRAAEAGLNCEWLVTNGLGGYASGTLSGVITRRYHGYLVAALPAPFGRIMMLNELGERLEFAGGIVAEVARRDFEQQKDNKDWLVEFPPDALRVLGCP